MCDFSVILILEVIMTNTNINFNKNKGEWKIENPAHTFREMNLVFPLIQEPQIKSKTHKLELAK